MKEKMDSIIIMLKINNSKVTAEYMFFSNEHSYLFEMDKYRSILIDFDIHFNLLSINELDVNKSDNVIEIPIKKFDTVIEEILSM